MTDYNIHPSRQPVSYGGEHVVYQGLPESVPFQLSSARSYSELNYLFGAQDQTMFAPTTGRNRRRSDRGSDHTKHRRTRSGCYTCRSRRVKCDEVHPICERCKKGGRECVYPDPSTSSKSSANKSTRSNQSTGPERPGSSSDEEDDEIAEPSQLESILDGDETGYESTQSANRLQYAGRQGINDEQVRDRQSSETPSLVYDKGSSPTPSTEGSIGYSPYQNIGSQIRKQSFSLDNLKSNWSHLPQDLQFYLQYFNEHLTYLHYSIKCDPANVLKTEFIEAALQNEALLYAIVGFSAFQYTLHKPNGRVQDFLQYYNKAVSLLLRSLKRGERHSNATILAILQLATIEEFLGDWINLLGHQKAAYRILTELHTPQTVMQSSMSRIILAWYMRFDVFAGLMGGFEMVLSREWFVSSEQYLQEQVANNPMDLNWKIELSFANIRRIAMDMSTVFAKIGKGEITIHQFVEENKAVGRMIKAWKDEMDPALQDERFLVIDYPTRRPLDPDDIVDPYIPRTIYRGPLWLMNIAHIDWYAIDMMHKYQTALTLKALPTAELALQAYASCQLFETIEFFSESPPGTILALQASLGIACLFLPRDQTHAMWGRRKLAAIESQGYIYPYTFRTKMSDLFRDRSCMHWWLPNDEGYPPIIRSIRKFVEERTAPAVGVAGKDLRDMKAIFSSLKLDDGKAALPQTLAKGKDREGGVTVVGEQEHWMAAPVD
ncbi:hypothetical protein B0O99DRAFT_689147 [Bisporella sp. PMI_857]|nr:hypothetical protein B0O99DRAFT_689147 [Bisporella sp. PMI_857]